jgi:hypothetical protein
VTALVSGKPAIFAFVVAMLAGFLLHDAMEVQRSARARRRHVEHGAR